MYSSRSSKAAISLQLGVIVITSVNLGVRYIAVRLGVLLHNRRSYFLYVRGLDLHRCAAQDIEADIDFGFPVG